jgi:hypothetical protein
MQGASEFAHVSDFRTFGGDAETAKGLPNQGAICLTGADAGQATAGGDLPVEAAGWHVIASIARNAWHFHGRAMLFGGGSDQFRRIGAIALAKFRKLGDGIFQLLETVDHDR